MSNLIYHYTSLNALYEIIKTKSLLLPTLHGMNDPLECGYKPDMFISDLDFDKYPQKSNDDTKAFFNLLYLILKKNKNQFVRNCRNKTAPYCLSYSLKEDNISHWERYGDNMKGVCIAFDSKEIELLNPPLGYEIYLRKIIYKDEDRRKYIRTSIVNFYNEINKSLDPKNKDQFIEIIKKNCVPSLAGIYLSIHYFIKNEYWNDEDEIRLLYDEHSWNETLNLLKKIVSNGGEEQTPYVRNKSSKTIYYKPEKNIRNYRNDGAYPIEAGKDLYMPVDGIAAPHLRKGEVYKITNNTRVTVTNNDVSYNVEGLKNRLAMSLKGGWQNSSWHYMIRSREIYPVVLENQPTYYIVKQPDMSWDKLFSKSK